MAESREREEPVDELDAEQRARRRLLKLSVYAAPAILGSLLVSRDLQAQAFSCNPARCKPYSDPICRPARCKPGS